ncbi:hypothetical protein [Flavobacterium restrictum]|uniref:Uncharacterized protein n=1 Tax=Flavobacterium restrictum TaxID=2594428 RepID=A0A553E916_9FLAO|nr:hypothetical protein [Flavobacterium restrictum]TRX41537.1 hypothetical protein FNW21_05435 [Flavobacterium restrictum]
MFKIFNDLWVKINNSESVWDYLKDLLPNSKQSIVESDAVLIALFLIGVGLLVVVFIVLVCNCD